MVDSYALDSSVLVASLIPSDKNNGIGKIVLKRLLDSNDLVYASVIVPVEVCAAVARRTRDRAVAKEVTEQMAKWIQLGRLHLLSLNFARMKKAQKLGMDCYTTGLDAIIAEVAEEKKIPLVTFDQELAERIVPRVKTITSSTFSEEFKLE